MDDLAQQDGVAPEGLRTELEQSKADLVAGRVKPVRAVLAQIHLRALERMERSRSGIDSDRAKTEA